MAGSKTDERRVKRALRGNTRAYGELVDDYEQQAVAAALSLCGDLEAARDIAQEAFVEAYRSLEKLKEPAKFRAWLHGIIRNLARRHLSHRNPDQISLERERVNEPGRSSNEGYSDTMMVLQALPLKHRDMLTAKYVLEMDYEEIAEMFDITVNNARVRCFRARQALREAMARGESGE